MKKKILGILMSLALVAQVLVVPTFAATEDTGLIIDSKGTTNNNWVAYDSNATVTATEDAVVMSETAETTGYAKMIYSIPEADQITFSQDNTVVIEMVVNPNITPVDTYGSYLAFRFNAPENAAELAAYKSKNNTEYSDGLYAQTLGGFCKAYYLGVQGAWSNTVSTVPYDGSRTYKMVSYLSESGTKANVYFYDENGAELWKNIDQTFTDANVDNSTVLRNIAVTELNPTKGTLNACTVSSLKIYNVPNEAASNYASYTERITSAFAVENVKIGDADLDGATNVTAGDITFTATGDGEIGAELSYVKNDYIGTKGITEATLTAGENNSYTLSANFEPDSTYTLKVTDGTSSESYTFTTEDGYTAKYGLVASTEGATTDGFTLYNTTRDTMNAEADGYVRLTQGAIGTAQKDYAGLNFDLGDNKIKFSDEDTIVIETRIRARVDQYKEWGSYLHMGYNMPKNAAEEAALKVYDSTGNVVEYNSPRHYLTLGGISHEYLYGINGDSESSESYNKETIMDSSKMTEGQEMSLWRKMVVKMNGTTAQITIYDEDENETAIYTGTETAISFKSLSNYLENIGFIGKNAHHGILTTDVDYIRVYNMPKGYEENYADFTSIVEKEATMYKKTNGAFVIDADEVVIKDASNEDVDFVATETEDGLVVRMLDFTAGNYTVNGAKYVVTAPYTATLANGKFVTDIPEIFNAEGAIFYKANYDATTGRLLAVDVITEIVAETDSQTVATDATTKVFLWNANMKPIKLR